CDAPDSAVGVIAAGIAEIDLVVLDDEVVPVCDVERAVRADLNIYGAEFLVLRRDQRRKLASGKLSCFVVNGEPIDLLRLEPAGDEIVLEVGREMPSGDELEAGMAVAADLGHRERGDEVGIVGGVERRVGEDAIDVSDPGAGGERSA